MTAGSIKYLDINLDPNIYICLDLEIESTNRIKKVQIQEIELKITGLHFVDDEEKSFDKVEDAKKYLE